MVWKLRRLRPVSYSRFCPQAAQGRIKPLRVRPYQPDDEDTCQQLYRANEEEGRFPSGRFEEYARALRNAPYAFLLAWAEKECVGVGGLAPAPDGAAQFIFGLVRPDWQGRGVGAALLLSRIRLLPEPTDYTRLMLAPVTTSASYYARYGFRFHMKVCGDEEDLDRYDARLYPEAWHECGSMLDQAGLILEASAGTFEVGPENTYGTLPPAQSGM